MIPFCHGQRPIEVLGDDHGAQQAGNDVGIARVVLHQIAGNPHEAGTLGDVPFPQAVGLDGGQGQEGGSAAVPLFQILYGTFAFALVFYDDILFRAAQSNFNSYSILVRHPKQTRYRAMDALQVLARCPHDRLDRLRVALIGSLHLLQHGNPAVQPPCLHGELLHPLVGLLFLGPALL